MGCAAGRPQQLPLQPGPIPLSSLAAPDTPTSSVEGHPYLLPLLALPGSDPASHSHTVWEELPRSFRFPQPQREIQSVYLSSGTLGRAF